MVEGVASGKREALDLNRIRLVPIRESQAAFPLPNLEFVISVGQREMRPEF